MFTSGGQLELVERPKITKSWHMLSRCNPWSSDDDE
jgi:hypothetical protein